MRNSWAVGAVLVAATIAQFAQEGPRQRELEYQRDAERAFTYVRANVPPGYTGGGSGSGVWIDDHRILTVAHNQPSPGVELTVTAHGAIFLAEVIARDPKSDLMLLQVNAKAPKTLRIASRAIPRWTRVAVVGAPIGAPGVCFVGIVSGANPIVGTLLLDIQGTGGLSGSAVVALEGRDAGRVAGIVFRSWGDSRLHMTVAVDAPTIKRFLDSVH